MESDPSPPASHRWRPRPKVIIGVFVAGILIVFGAIQLLPYGRDHSNPPITGEPAWATPQTRQLMVDACFGCHSNEVVWPWYSNIAPISWIVTNHVDEGRDAVNYSEFATDPGDADESVESILEGEMPPGYYTMLWLHPEADLDQAETAELVAGLRATPGLAEGGGDDHDDDGDDAADDDDDDDDD